LLAFDISRFIISFVPSDGRLPTGCIGKTAHSAGSSRPLRPENVVLHQVNLSMSQRTVKKPTFSGLWGPCSVEHTEHV